MAHLIAVWTIGGLSVASLFYATGALAVLLKWLRTPTLPPRYRPAVSVLKPLCGAERELYDNLRSFCDQQYPEFEVLFGVRSGADPAAAVVDRLKRELPERAIALIVDERLVGPNHKISNLSNILPHARYDHLVVADSDIRVGPTYLSAIVDALSDPGVGLVTCLYRGRPLGTVWSYLGALLVDAWFLPSVLVAQAIGFNSFCFGASVALRRSVLDQIGGFDSLAWQLADDYALGARVRARGLRVVLSPYLVETTVYEPNPRALIQHELRWARTIRTVQPLGHALAFVTYAIPVSCVAAVTLWGTHWALALPALAIALRGALHLAINGDRPRQAIVGLLLVPLRGFLSLAIWAASFGSRRVRWRHQELCVRADGQLFDPIGAPSLEVPISGREKEFQS